MENKKVEKAIVGCIQPVRLVAILCGSLCVDLYYGRYFAEMISKR